MAISPLPSDDAQAEPADATSAETGTEPTKLSLLAGGAPLPSQPLDSTAKPAPSGAGAKGDDAATAGGAPLPSQPL